MAKRKWFVNELFDQIYKIKCSRNAKLLLLCLAKFADKEGLCFPTTEQLSRMSGIGQGNLYRHFKELIKLKILEVKRKKIGAGRMTRNFYTINIKAILEVREENGELTATIHPDSDVKLNKFSSDNEQSKKGSIHHSDVLIDRSIHHSDVLLLSTNYPTKEELPKDLKDIVRQEHSDEMNVSNLLSDCLFHQFWSAYPRKEKKKEAYRIWKRDKLERIGEEIIQDVRLRQIKHDRWADHAYIPMPTTYLHNECWNDEITERTANEHNRQQTTVDQASAKENKRERQLREAFDKYDRVRSQR